MLPPGLTRADVSVTVDYHTVGQDKFILRDKNGSKLATVNGRTRPSRSVRDRAYPEYEVTTADGITEVLKVKPYRENENMVQNGKKVALFYVVDDPAIRKEVLAARGVQ